MATQKQLQNLAKARAVKAAKKSGHSDPFAMMRQEVSSRRARAHDENLLQAQWAMSGGRLKDKEMGEDAAAELERQLIGPRLPGHKGAGIAPGLFNVPAGFHMRGGRLVRMAKKKKSARRSGKTKKALMREQNKLLKAIAEDCGPLTKKKRKKSGKKKVGKKKRGSKKRASKKVRKSVGAMSPMIIASKALKGASLPASVRKAQVKKIANLVKKIRANC